MTLNHALKITNPHTAHKNHSQARGREKEQKNDLEARGSRRGTPKTPTGVKKKI
jgi:hypothetical protein